MPFDSHEYAVDDVTKSKTRECRRYSFELKKVIFHFIDTPGINDTGGLLSDSKNIEKIFTYVQELPHINVIIFIMNGAVPRATVNVENVLAKFRERLPDAVYHNMLIVLTNCQSHTVNFHPSELGLPATCQEFYMQNSVFSSDPQSWSERTKQSMDKHFKASINTINEIIRTLRQLVPQSITDFKNMNDNRNSIKCELHDARLTLLDLQTLEDELTLLQESSNIHALNASKFQDYVREKQIIITERVKTEYHNTCCSVCDTVCHEKCNLNEIPSLGSYTFFRCSALQYGYCSKCPKQCSPLQHYHARWIICPKASTMADIIYSRQQRYNKEKAGQEKADIKFNDLQKTKQFIEQELQCQYSRVADSIRRSRQTCSNFNVTEEILHFVDCLKKEVLKLHSPSVTEKAKNFISMLIQLSDEMPCASISQSENSSSSALVSSTYRDLLAERQSERYEDSHKKKDKVQSIEKRQKTVPAASNALTMVRKEKTSAILRCDSDTDEFYPAESEFINNSNFRRSQYERDEKATFKPEKSASRKSYNGESNYKSYTLCDLIEENRFSKSKAISDELRLRLRGKSVGLLTTNELVDLCEHFSNNSRKSLADLVVIKEQLDDEIQAKIDDDLLNIGKVNHATLLQLAAINMLINRATIGSLV